MLSVRFLLLNWMWWGALVDKNVVFNSSSTFSEFMNDSISQPALDSLNQCTRYICDSFFIHLSQSNSLRQMYDRWPHELDVNRVFITNYTLKYTYRKSQLKHSEFFFLEKRTIVFKCACFILNYSIFNWLLFEQFRKPNMHYTYGNNSYSFFSLSHSAAARTFAIQVICTSMRIAGGLLTIDHIQLTATFTTNQKSITR